MAASRRLTEEERYQLVTGLAERGYNANLIHDDGWGPDGYYMAVKDAKGNLLRGPNGAELVWQHWDDPEHYEFVRDWFEGKITDD